MKDICFLSIHLVFLQSYTRCAQISIQEGKHRFGLMPKLHFLHHTAWRLIQECGRADWCINPMSETVQMQEDFIGRPSRISRRIDVRLLHRRVMDRSLICAQQAQEASDLDQRGLLLSKQSKKDKQDGDILFPVQFRCLFAGSAASHCNFCLLSRQGIYAWGSKRWKTAMVIVPVQRFLLMFYHVWKLQLQIYKSIVTVGFYWKFCSVFQNSKKNKGAYFSRKGGFL